MAQTWTLGEIPTRPGVAYRVERGDVTTVPAVNGVCAVLLSSNWGPLNQVVDIDISQLNNITDIFGNDGREEVLRQALIGGARRLKVVRVGSGGGVMGNWLYSAVEEIVLHIKRAVPANGELSVLTGRMALVKNTLKFVVTNMKYKAYELNTDYTLIETKNAANTEYTKRTVKFTEAGLAKVAADGGQVHVYERFKPAAEKLVRLWSRFKGSRAFTMTLKTDPISGKRQFLVYDGTTLFDKIEFAAGGDEAKKFVETINATSTKFHARYDKAGVLADFASRKNYPGIDPTANLAAYSKGMDILEREYWNTIIVDRNGENISSLLVEFVKQCSQTGRLGIAVLGGINSDSWATRKTYAKAINSPYVVYVPSGWKDTSGTGWQGYRAAARIAGMIAGSETHSSLTHATIDGAVDLMEPLSHYEIVRGIESGCLMLSKNDDDQIQIDYAITTLINPDEHHDDGWKKIRRVKCRQALMTRINRTCDRLIGKLNNSPDGRATLVAAMNSVVREMAASGDLVAGSYFEEDSRYPPIADVAYFIGIIRDFDSLERVLISFNFAYGQSFD